MWLNLVLIASILGSIFGFVPISPGAGWRSSYASHQSSLTANTLDGDEIEGALEPYGNFLLVEIRMTADTSKGGIYIPDSAKERATEGIVVAAGPGRVHPETALQLDMPGFCHLSL
jgi:chaperonin GroES